MTATSVLDDQTVGAIRQAISMATAGHLAEACGIGERALANGGDPAALNAMLGMLRCRAGDFETGIEHLRAAHRSRPGDPTIATNLATALAERGDYREAFNVVTGQLARADASMRLERLRGFLTQTLEDYDAAIGSYERVVAAVPADWESWNNLGNARRSAGDFDGSVTALRRAVELNPESAPVRLNLALAVGASGDFPEAERQLRSMAEDCPEDTMPLRELHALLRELGREEEALEAIEAAVQRDPSDIGLLLALASQRSLLLKTEAAEAAYRQALSLDPANSLANLGLAVVFEQTNRTEALSSLVKEAQERGVSDEALNFIRAFDHRRAKRFSAGLAALAEVPEELETTRRAHLLGQLQEGVGNYDKAFEAFSRMNELQREDLSRPEERAAAYRRSIRERYEIVTRDWMRGWRDAETAMDNRPSPVFLVGFPRSGTTLLDTMLMGHPQIEVLEEEPAIRHANELLSDFAKLPTATDEQIRAARDAYFRTAASLTPMQPGNLLVDKNPLALNGVPLIHRLFPDARIILALRHPCDVVLSCFITNFKPNDGMANFLRLDTAAELYELSFSFFERAQQAMKLPMHTVIYENVVADRDRELRSLLDFLALDWSDEVLDHQATARSRGRIKTASYAQVTEPIYQRAAGRWIHYRKHLEPILPVLAPWAEKFGYKI